MTIEDLAGYPQLEKCSYELYDIIGIMVSGEALTIVLSFDDMSGLDAWRRLNRKHAPKTPARALVKLTEALNSGRAKAVHELATRLDSWEVKVNMFEKEKRTKDQLGSKAQKCRTRK